MAFAQLRALAGPHRFRVMADAEGFPIIPGRYGQIEWTGGPSLAVYCERPRLFQKLWAIPGVTRHQTGDDEMRAVLPHEALEQVASKPSWTPPRLRGGPMDMMRHGQNGSRRTSALTPRPH